MSFNSIAIPNQKVPDRSQCEELGEGVGCYVLNFIGLQIDVLQTGQEGRRGQLLDLVPRHVQRHQAEPILTRNPVSLSTDLFFQVLNKLLFHTGIIN